MQPRKVNSTTMIERIPEFPTLTIIRHPLVQHKLTIMRNRETPTKIFKELVDEIADAHGLRGNDRS
jgi:uracil phosphoribosyltransferase